MDAIILEEGRRAEVIRRERARENHIVVRGNVRQGIVQGRLGGMIFWMVTVSVVMRLIVIGLCLFLARHDPVKILPLVYLLSLSVNLILGLIPRIYFYRLTMDSSDEAMIWNVLDEMGHDDSSSWSRFMMQAKSVSFRLDSLILAVGLISLFDYTLADVSPSVHLAVVMMVCFSLLQVLLPVIMVTMIICCLGVASTWIPQHVAVGGGGQMSVNSGATEEEIERIPIYVYTLDVDRYGSVKIDAEDASCAICIDDYVDGVNLRVLSCRHHFHATCVDQWLKLQSKCPLCMRSVIGNSVSEDHDELGEEK